MAAQVRFLDSDGSTVITTENQGSILSPGSSSNKKLYVENFGDQTAQSVTVTIEQVGTNDGNGYGLIALDVAGSPGAFVNTSISLGNIVASAKTAFWLKSTLVAGLSAEGNTREYTLHAAGATI